MAAAQNIFAKQAVCFRLFDGGLQAGHRQRIFCAHIDIALVGTHCDTGNHHAFQHTVRITFHDAAIHKGAGIALVAITYDVFFIAVLSSYLRPFTARRVTAAAAAAQICLFHLFYDLFAAHIKQRFFKRTVPTQCQIFFQGIGVDVSAMLQYISSLFFIERNFFLLAIDLPVFLIRQALDVFPTQHGLLQNLFTIFWLHLDIQVSARLQANQRPHFTKAVAAALFQADRFVVRLFFQTHFAANAAFLHQL